MKKKINRKRNGGKESKMINKNENIENIILWTYPMRFNIHNHHTPRTIHRHGFDSSDAYFSPLFWI